MGARPLTNLSGNRLSPFTSRITGRYAHQAQSSLSTPTSDRSCRGVNAPRPSGNACRNRQWNECEGHYAKNIRRDKRMLNVIGRNKVSPVFAFENKHRQRQRKADNSRSCINRVF